MSDKKNNSPEIFKGKENEIKQEFEKKGYDWEKVKSELEKIEKKEEIDKKLTELEGKTEDYVTYLEGLLKDKEKLKKAEPEKKGIVDKAVENGKKAVIEEAEKKGSFYGKIARFFLEGTDEKAEDTFFTKVWNGMKVGIGMAILGFFGIKGISALTEAKKEEIKETVSNAVTSGTEAAVSATERVGESVKSAFTEKVDEVKGNTNDKISQGKEIVGDLTKDKYSSIGFTFLKTFSLETKEISTNTDIKELFSKFSNKTYLELETSFRKMDNNGKMNEAGVLEFISQNPELEIYRDKKEDIYTLMKILVSQKTSLVIFKNNLNKTNIENILNETGEEKINSILGEGKFQEIKDKNFDFTNLDMKTNLTLIGLSYRGVMASTLIGGFEASKNFVYDFLFMDGNLLNEIKSDLESRKENLLPTKVIDCIKGNSGFDKFGGIDRVNDKIDKFDTSKLTDLEKQKLINFLDFRDKILAELRSPNSKFALGLGNEFVENFDKIINLKQIIYLYFVFDGKADFIDSKDVAKTGLIYVWLSKSFKDNKETSNFGGIYGEKIVSNLYEGTNFSEDEKLFYQIIATKIGDKVSKHLIEGAKFVEGFVRGQLKGILEKGGVPENVSNEVAKFIEGIGGLAVLFVGFKKFSIPLIAVGGIYIGTILLALVNEGAKNNLSDENYKQARKLADEILKDGKYTSHIKDKNGKEGLFIADSFNTLEKASENLSEVQKEQNTSVEIPFKNFKLEIYENLNQYNFIKDGKKYRINFAHNSIGNSIKRWITSKNTFDNYISKKDGYDGYLEFGNGADNIKISYNDIEKAFSGSTIEVDGAFGLIKYEEVYPLGDNYVLTEVK